MVFPANLSLMAPLLLLSLLLLALTGPYSVGATYCVCKDGIGDQALQKALDYACGAGADCSPILSSGACYNPNTVKSHCDYAVNSYFQRKGQASGSCEFAGAATPSASPPAGQTTTCVYPASPSTTGGTTTTPPTGTTPSITPPTGTVPSITPPTGTTPSSTPTSPTTPSTGSSTTPSTGTTTTPPTGTSTSTTTPSATPSIYNSGTGLGPSSITDKGAPLSSPSWATFTLSLLLLRLFSFLLHA